MAKPEVTVIITSYNLENYIKPAIDSALSQQNISLEIIVVDDASTDNTWNIIASISDPRLKAIQMNKNLGPGAARNVGLKQANGEWIAILDGDDQFLPARLERCLHQAKVKQADIIIDNILTHNESDGKQQRMFPPEFFATHPQLDLANFIAGNCLFQRGYTLGYVKPIFRTAFLRKHALAYAPDILIGEDYHFLTSCLACGAHCITEQRTGYRYTIRKHSISYRLTLEDIERMQTYDAKLVGKYHFPESARRAQEKRTQSLRRATAYTRLVTGLKNKNAHTVISAILANPSAVLLLWLPLKVRMKRLRKMGKP